MFEATTNPAARAAMNAAHAERGRAVSGFWNWLFGTVSR